MTSDSHLFAFLSPTAFVISAAMPATDNNGVTSAQPFSLVIIIIKLVIYTSLRERDKREKSEEKIDCHHQDSNQGPSLVASDALTTEH